MTTLDLKNLFVTAYNFAETKFGKRPDSISIEEDGTITVKWETYVGCGEWESETETINIEDLNLTLNAEL